MYIRGPAPHVMYNTKLLFCHKSLQFLNFKTELRISRTTAGRKRRSSSRRADGPWSWSAPDGSWRCVAIMGNPDVAGPGQGRDRPEQISLRADRPAATLSKNQWSWRRGTPNTTGIFVRPQL